MRKCVFWIPGALLSDSTMNYEIMEYKENILTLNVPVNIIQVTLWITCTLPNHLDTSNTKRTDVCAHISVCVYICICIKQLKEKRPWISKGKEGSTEEVRERKEKGVNDASIF